MRPRRLASAATLLVTVTVGFVTGCANSSEPTGETTKSPSATPSTNSTNSTNSATSVSPTTAPSPSFRGRAISVTVIDGEVRPQVGRVAVTEGDAVRIVVVTDQPDTVHVHGYDLEKDTKPGKPAVIDFTADTTGVFEVETHDGDLRLFELAVE